jgi:hypothetical protein
MTREKVEALARELEEKEKLSEEEGRDCLMIFSKGWKMPKRTWRNR